MVEHNSAPPEASRNNFDTLRLLAATAVLVSHSFVIGGAGLEPLTGFSGEQKITLGQVAVYVFFAISGYLITGSYLNLQRPVAFVWRRALRILPALAITLVLTAFVLGPAVTTLTPSAYFGDPQPYVYVVRNLVFLTTFALPGVFADNPYPTAVNGSLWTLGPEVACYIFVFILGLVRGLNRWVLLAACVGATGLLALDIGPSRLNNMFIPFAVGALIYVTKTKLDWRIALLALAASAASLRFGYFDLVAPWCGTYLVHFIARSPMIRLPRLPFDPSYGVYILAFPVQQLIAMRLRGPDQWLLSLVLTLVVVFPLATVSWFWIEKPATGLKNALPKAWADFGRRDALPWKSASR